MTFLLSGGALPVAAFALLAAVVVCVGTARAAGLAAVGGQHARAIWWAWRVGAAALWALACAGVAFVTLWLANPNGGGVNLVPLVTIGSQLNQASGLAAFNLLGNAVMLVPCALLGRPAWQWTWPQTTLAAALGATTIEALQWLTGRSADVDDVLLNTLGAAMAAAVSAWIARRHSPAEPRMLAPQALTAAVPPATVR